MPHGGYHGTIIRNNKITQLGDEFKDSQGNIKPQFNVTGDKDSGFNVSMAQETFNPRAREAMYAGPDDILQNIIDRKDVLKLQQSPDRPGMNLYQDLIQDFRTSSPTNMAAYGQRFPMQQFMMEGPKSIAQNTLLGGIISAIGGGKDKIGEFASGLFPQGFMPGLGAEFEKLGSQLAAAPGNFKKELVKMFTKDDEPTKASLREDFNIKKNTAEDIVEGSLIAGEAIPEVTQTDVPFVNLNQIIDPSESIESYQKNLINQAQKFPVGNIPIDDYTQAVLDKMGIK
jgi:hypothetical protein